MSRDHAAGGRGGTRPAGNRERAPIRIPIVPQALNRGRACLTRRALAIVEALDAEGHESLAVLDIVAETLRLAGERASDARTPHP